MHSPSSLVARPRTWLFPALALVLALVLPFVAIPVAHRVIRTLQHEGGRGLAVAQAAIVVGYIDILLWALVCLNLAVAVLLHPAVG